MAALAGPSTWQSLIRQRLEERDSREKSYDEIITNCESDQRVTRHARMLEERSRSMLSAAGARSNAAPAEHAVASTVAVAAGGGGAAAPASTDKDNAVQRAYLASLEQQLNAAKDELSMLYKTQSQNAQRLLVLNEQLRDRDDKEREGSENVKRLVDESARVKRREEDLKAVLGEKDKMIQLLQDELSTLSLELSQVESRNDDLSRDNAMLVQRWLDKMNEQVDKMNEGNRIEEEKSKRGIETSDETDFEPIEGAGKVDDKGKKPA
ncbi:autophagy protein 16 [Acaromyces ingoldii]|uniref:Autophagy protein 16 n=1 Tax=Acaromyces ingoldii TaxID=215250 RepID=A0A316YLN2_9BASI|nr:autophagy protein 16 [Acaromyces ingoldii]PWN90287.1 autophagy protein 16 [Acaromyces ingoldii]